LPDNNDKIDKMFA